MFSIFPVAILKKDGVFCGQQFLFQLHGLIKFFEKFHTCIIICTIPSTISPTIYIVYDLELSQNYFFCLFVNVLGYPQVIEGRCGGFPGFCVPQHKGLDDAYALELDIIPSHPCLQP